MRLLRPVDVPVSTAAYTNRRLTSTFGWIVTAVITLLNVALSYLTVTG